MRTNALEERLDSDQGLRRCLEGIRTYEICYLRVYVLRKRYFGPDTAIFKFL